EQLVAPEPQDVEHRGVDLAERALRALLEDRVVPPAQPQGPVRELGREGRVTPCDRASAEHGWQDEVRVRGRAVDLAQHVEGREPGRVRGAAPLARRRPREALAAIRLVAARTRPTAHPLAAALAASGAACRPLGGALRTGPATRRPLARVLRPGPVARRPFARVLRTGRSATVRPLGP